MIYINKDLDFIFIRTQDKNNKWINLSIRQLNKKQWERWLISKSNNNKKFWKSINNKIEQEEWTDLDKLKMINWLAKRGIEVVMIARGDARKKRV